MEHIDQETAKEFVQIATEAGVIMCDLAGDHYIPARRDHYQRELAGKLDWLERQSREIRQVVESTPPSDGEF